MPIHAQVKATKPVTRQTVTTALQHNSFWAVVGHDCLNDRLENVSVGFVRYAVAKRKVDRVVLAGAHTDVAKLASTGEVLAVLVEGHGHDAIGCIKGFFDTIAVVHVNVDVQNALLVSQKLDNAEDDVCEISWGWRRYRRILTVDITKTTSFALLCVMQSAGPVDRDIALPAVQTRRALHGASRADTAELEQAVKDGTVVSNVVLALLFGEAVHVVRRDLVQELDVLVGVELRHFVLGRGFGALSSDQSKVQEQWEASAYVNFHLGVESVVHDQTMRHPYAMGLHGMASYIGIIAHVGVVEVGHFLRACPCTWRQRVHPPGWVTSFFFGHFVLIHQSIEAWLDNLTVRVLGYLQVAVLGAAAIVMGGLEVAPRRDNKASKGPDAERWWEQRTGASASFNRGGRHPCLARRRRNCAPATPGIRDSAELHHRRRLATAAPVNTPPAALAHFPPPSPPPSFTQHRQTSITMDRLSRMLAAAQGMGGMGGPAQDTNLIDNSETVYISSLALLKMLRHGRAGVPMEVMGLMLGEFVDDYTVRVVDVFAMPQSGTGVSVEAVDPVFQTKMMDMLRQTGRCVLLARLVPPMR
jgi:hypothetical protein